MSYPSEIEKYNQREQRFRLYQFLRALDNKYDAVKKEIINKDPLPTVRQAYGMVRREAMNSGVLKAESNELHNGGIGAGLAAVNRPPQPTGHTPYTANRGRTGEEDKKWLTCSHYGGKKHTKEGCFLLIGFPEWWDEMKRARATRGGRSQNREGREAVAMAGGNWTGDEQATSVGSPANTGPPTSRIFSSSTAPPTAGIGGQKGRESREGEMGKGLATARVPGNGGLCLNPPISQKPISGPPMCLICKSDPLLLPILKFLPCICLNLFLAPIVTALYKLNPIIIKSHN